MSFQQLSTIIPILIDVTLLKTSQIHTAKSDCHAILIVKYGHVTITPENQPPIICTEGFALNAKEGPFLIEIPKTRSAEYVLITYRLFPENQEWALSGLLYSISEEKIYYMLDELIRIRTLSSNKQDPGVQSFRERLMLERILFIYLFESAMKKEKNTTMSLIEETVSYLNQHYMLEIKLPLLADRAGLSVGHYTVVFKKHTGMTVKAYLLKLRIEKAKQYLAQSNLTAKEVGKRVGFYDYFHFSRSFKKAVGCSPTIFRANVEKI
ncbi:AraC family transcriptional regulator [Bacillus sp. F19]|nr:AraC family transcriptional regulator [Bacillus sp. F19]